MAAFTPSASAPSYVGRAVAGSLGLFALLRLAWTEAHLVLPLTAAQATVAGHWFGEPARPLQVTAACSGVDAMALCLAAILAYPASWRSRLTGAGAGAALILALNTIRIGTLGRAAGSPRFDLLHLYVWPMVLTTAIAVFVFGWMRRAERAAAPGAAVRMTPPSTRFIVLAALLLVAFVAGAPLYLESSAVLALASVVARFTARILAGFGGVAHADGNVLWTAHGGFLVTQECIATPLIPVYLAMVGAYATDWPRRLAGTLAAVPIFVALGIVRLLLVALPPALASPLFWVHSFYQVLSAVLVVCGVAFWRHRQFAARRAALGIAVGVSCGIIAAPIALRIIAVMGLLPETDAQGAIAFLPAFQVALFAALCVVATMTPRWPRVATGGAALCLSILATLALFRALAQYGGLVPHVRDIRAWALLAPALAAAAVMKDARSHR